MPAGIDVAGEDIQRELDRRKPGNLASASPRREEDQVEILSGLFEGKTTGTPIALLIRNCDAKSSDYEELREILRPGQGDFGYQQKFGLRDHRGGGRSSARETAARVAAGALAGKILDLAGIEVLGFTRAIGEVEITETALEALILSPAAIRQNPLFCPDPVWAARMEEQLTAARLAKDSLGGVMEIRVRHCPSGLGEPVFHKLDADLAGALMSIGSVKGVEIGTGFILAKMKGSQANDQMDASGFLSNHAGGILGGISTGQEIILRAACKPIPTIGLPQRTCDIHGHPREISLRGRHDVSSLPRVVPVGEAMVKLVLADHLLRQRTARW
jgi:chorismate synthase